MRTRHLNKTRWIVVGLFLCALAVPALSRVSNQMSITINNNSSREITHVYLSPPNEDNWSADQLNNSVLSAGGSVNLSNVSCNSQIKVIAEDRDGCFAYQLVSCDADATWSITNDTARDCGN